MQQADAQQGDADNRYESPEATLEEVVQAMRAARSVLVITGAGISADSGLPTYRGVGGLYERDLTEDAVPIEVALSGETMRRSPEITWKYILQIESACRGVRHNRAHAVIGEMEQVFERLCVLTQNIEGFHRDAGSTNLVEMHGNIHHLYCVVCDYRTRVADYSEIRVPPACPQCGSLVRPDVVLFGESLPRRATLQLYAEMYAGFDLIFSVGTTSVFPYIADPVLQAAEIGIPTVEINPGESEVSHVARYRLQTRAAPTLDKLWRRYSAT
jgi:NAD-dependent deacetylase